MAMATSTVSGTQTLWLRRRLGASSHTPLEEQLMKCLMKAKVPAAPHRHAEGRSQQSPPQAHLKSHPAQPLLTIPVLRAPAVQAQTQTRLVRSTGPVTRSRCNLSQTLPPALLAWPKHLATGQSCSSACQAPRRVHSR